METKETSSSLCHSGDWDRRWQTLLPLSAELNQPEGIALAALVGIILNLILPQTLNGKAEDNR